MYNYNTILTYRDYKEDIKYKKELLKCFYLTEYNERLSKEIERLFINVNKYYKNIINVLKKNYFLLHGSSDETCFLFLFSWDFFYENHQLLKEIHNKTNIQNKKKIILELNLINKIKKCYK